MLFQYLRFRVSMLSSKRNPPDLSTTMVGREQDIHSFTRAAQDYPMTFLYGESGSGKSTLIKLGVARELAQSRTWIPIYVDIWGQDWVHGPGEAF